MDDPYMVCRQGKDRTFYRLPQDGKTPTVGFWREDKGTRWYYGDDVQEAVEQMVGAGWEVRAAGGEDGNA